MNDVVTEPLEEEKRDARALAFELAASGHEVPDEVVSTWARTRREQVGALRAMPPERATRLLALELSRIERDLRFLEGGETALGGEAALRVVDCGERLRWVLWLADALSEELTMDPLALVEEELRRVELQARDQIRWGSEGPDVEPLLVRIRAAELSILGCRLERFVAVQPGALEAGALERATRRWLAASEAFYIEGDLAREGALLDGAASIAGDEGLESLRRERLLHLEEARAALATCRPEEVEEFARTAVADLLDHVGGILSEGDSGVPAERQRFLELTIARIDAYHQVLGRWRHELARRAVLPLELRRRFRMGEKQLERARRQVCVALSEVKVIERLDDTFGHDNVRRFEAFIMSLIFALLGLVLCEWRLPIDLPPLFAARYGVEGYIAGHMIAVEASKFFNFIDLIFCSIFQFDFFVRWAFAGWTFVYFRRHFFAESLPALPYGFIFHHLGAFEEARSIIIIRALRARGATALRAVLLVFVRVFRVLVFFMRGVDRAVERFRHVLDRDVVIFAPEALAEAQESPLRRRASSLESRRQQVLRGLFDDFAPPERLRFLDHETLVLSAEARVASSLKLPYRRGVEYGRGEVRIERVIYNFLDCDVTRAVTLVGREGVEKVARWLRFVDVPGFRNFPVVRRLVPAARMLNPAEAVSFAFNAAGQVLQEFLGAVRFWADLSGITTGPQILDRLGTAIVIASKRPAIRLILFGTLFLVIEAVFGIFQWTVLSSVSRTIGNLLGLPILLLGSVCLIFFVLGRWFKRISGEALDYYMRTADAQFYPLVKTRKLLRREEDLEEIYGSVLYPEVRLRGDGEISKDDWLEFLAQPLRDEAACMPGRSRTSDPRFVEFVEDRETLVLLYRDFLDGPVLHRSDDKTSIQLLGNLSVQNVRMETLGVGIKELRRLERLSLERGSLLAFGPYFWFRFITESLSIETAKLVLEYNSACLPRDREPYATEAARQRFREFIEERQGKRPPTSPPRHDQRSPADLLTARFTALDFLCPTAEGDESIRDHFGDDVLLALRRDRRAVVRDIFGTRPYHLLPRDQRVFNPYRLYWKYLGGAKFFLLPVLPVLAVLRLLIAGVRQVRELIREVLGRERSRRIHLSRAAPFEVAVRKINRMRKPLFMEALRLRAAIDVEYLGLHLPGEEGHEDESTGITFERDLDFIGALEAERRPLVEHRDRAIRDLRRFRAFLENQGWNGGAARVPATRPSPLSPSALLAPSTSSSGEFLAALLDLIDPEGELRDNAREVLRALVTAYVTDHGELRSILTAPEWARSWFEEAARPHKRSLTEVVFDAVVRRLVWVFPTYRRRRALVVEYAKRAPEVGAQDKPARRRALARFLKADADAERMLRLALSVLRNESGTKSDAIVAALRRAAFDYRLWTRKLVTIRTIQTLTVLDVRNYRDLVWTVGDFGGDEKVPG